MSDTTSYDVAHDLLAALDMYAGTFGSEGTVIDELALVGGSTNGVVVTCSDGSRYQLTVEELAT